MRRIIIVAVFLLFDSTFLMAQPKPQWLKTTPQSLNYSYTFVPITAEASTMGTGRSECLQLLALDRNLLNSVTISQKSTRTDSDIQLSHSGSDQLGYESRTVTVTTFEGESIQLRAKIVDEYFDKKDKKYSTLYAIGLTNEACFDNIQVTSQYGTSGFWRSALVPGWGQMYKGDFLKGGLIMSGTVGFTGGIVSCESMKNNLLIKASHTHSSANAKQYQADINNALLGRNLCVGGLAALYLFNIIDAIVAPGGHRVIVTPVSYGNDSYGIGGTVIF